MSRRGVDQGVEVLHRLVPIAARISRLVGVYVVLVGIASMVIVITLVARFWPTSLLEVLAHLVIAAALLAPVGMLWLFHGALAEALRIPQRLITMPDVARDHGSELAGLVRDSQLRRERLKLTAAPGDLWRAGRLLLAAHDDLPDVGRLIALVSVPFLLASLVAAWVGLILIVVAPAVVAGAWLTSVV